MSNVVELDDYRQSIVVTTPTAAHIIPRRFFEDVAAGRRSLADIPDADDVIPTIIEDWLGTLPG